MREDTEERDVYQADHYEAQDYLLEKTREDLQSEIDDQEETERLEREMDADLSAEGLRKLSTDQPHTGLGMAAGPLASVHDATRRARGESGTQYLEMARAREEGRKFRERLPGFETMFSGPEHFLGAFEGEKRSLMESKLAAAVDRDAEVMATANMLFYEAMTGESVEDPERWMLQRTLYARKALGWRGASVMLGDANGAEGGALPATLIDDTTFYQLAGAKLKEQREEHAVMEETAREARLSVLNGVAMGEARERMKSRTGESWQRYEPALRAGYAGMMKEFSNREIKAVRPLYELFADALELAKVEDLHQGNALAALRIYALSDQAGRDRILSGIGMLAEADQQDVVGFYNRVATTWEKGNLQIFGNLTSGRMRANSVAITRILEQGKMPLNIGPNQVPDLETMLHDEGQQDWDRVDQSMSYMRDMAVWKGWKLEAFERPITKEERIVLADQKAQIDGLTYFLTDAPTAGIRIKRDLDTEKHDGFWDTVTDGLVMISGSVPHMTFAALPGGVGLVVLTESYYHRNLAQMRRANPDMPEEHFKQWAMSAAVLETGLDKLELLVAKANLPGLKTALYKWGKTGVVAHSAMGLAAAGTVNTGTEILQNLSLPMVEALAAATARDIKGPDWRAIYQREVDSLGDTALVSFGFAIIFGTGGKVIDYLELSTVSKKLGDAAEIELAGFTAEQARAVAELSRTDPAAAAELLRGTWAVTSVQQRRANAAAAKTRLKEERRAAQGADLPEHMAMPDGRVAIVYPDGRQEIVDGPEAVQEAEVRWEEEQGADLTQSIREDVDAIADEASRAGEDAADGGGEAFADLPGDISFSIEPSTPERDARALPELEIPGAAWTGDLGSFRRAVREMIATELQGKSITNKDTGEIIRFNSESKRESVSKVRKEPAFRAAMKIGTITEDAVRIGRVAAGKGKADTTERLDYYAMPLRIDGKRVYAWFNTRVPVGGQEAVFYEFGVFERKETQALQRPWEPSPAPGASRLGSDTSIGEFLAEIKETLPAAVKVAAEEGGGAALRGAPDADFEWEAAGEADAGMSASNDVLADAVSQSIRGATGGEVALDARTGQKLGTLEDIARKSAELTGKVKQRVQIALRQAGRDIGLDAIDLARIPVLGTSRNTFEKGITTIHARISETGSPLTVIEEAAEGIAKYLLGLSKVGEARMTGWLRDAEQRMGRKVLADNLAEMDADARNQEIVEAFSWLARANATGKVADSSLPDQVKAFFRAFKDYIANVLRIAADFARVRGQLDPEFTHWLDVSAGLTAQRRDGDAVGRNADTTGGAEVELEAGRSDGSIASDSRNGASFSIDVDKALEIHARVKAQAPLDVSLEHVPAGMTAKEARQWAADRGALGRTSHPELGKIEIRNPKIRGAAGKSLTPQKVAVLARMKELIPRATWVASPGRGDSDHVRLAARLQIEGQDYVARIVIDTDAKGKRFYNHELSDLRELPVNEAPQASATGKESGSRQGEPEVTREAAELVGWIEQGGRVNGSGGRLPHESDEDLLEEGAPEKPSRRVGKRAKEEEVVTEVIGEDGLTTTVINGYTFVLDHLRRVVKCSGKLTLNPNQKRNKKAQLEAGGSDRLSTDEGGHIIGRIFNGPLNKINHFAQDANFNRGAYRSLENRWKEAIKKGENPRIEIGFVYEGSSVRPTGLLVKTWFDKGDPEIQTFANRRGGR